MKNLLPCSWKWNMLLAVVAFLLLQSCKPAQQTTSAPAPQQTVTVTYEKDIRPIMVNHCTPCHFPEQGKKKMLDTYVATREDINEILIRIQLPASDEMFMPFRSKMPPLSAEQIQLFKEWVKQGTPN